MVAGCLCFSSNKDQLLLISSSGTPNKWVIPKGGVENDESIEQSALRETWEEAGVKGHIINILPVIEDMRPPKNWNKKLEQDCHGIIKHPPRTEYHLFELIVNDVCDEYPEKKRQRKWCRYDEAIRELAHRKELQRAVEVSSMKR
jgi:diphosphoinositol-polyphosphate diphosphatase